MKVLLLSFLIYLIGIAIVLYIRPNLMFQENGNWKEFGLSNDNKHTWFPFWLYCVVSAFISYAFSYFIYSVMDGSEATEEIIEEIQPKVKTKKTNAKKTSDMKSGYYVLDKEAYDSEGIPKYIFLGSESPNQNE